MDNQNHEMSLSIQRILDHSQALKTLLREYGDGTNDSSVNALFFMIDNINSIKLNLTYIESEIERMAK